jgi:hypothetical protein
MHKASAAPSGTYDKVCVQKLHCHAGPLQLTSKSLRPSRQERLAGRVDGEERGGDETGEGADRENQAALARDHAGKDKLGDLECCVTEVPE